MVTASIGMENLNHDQRDTVCKACALEPYIQIMHITRRIFCTSYETLKIMSIMKLSAHQINILNYTFILIATQDNSYFDEFFVYYTSYSNFNTWRLIGKDIEIQSAQAISPFPRIKVKNRMCECNSCALQLKCVLVARPYILSYKNVLDRHEIKVIY